MLKKPYVDFRTFKNPTNDMSRKYWEQQEGIKIANDIKRKTAEDAKISELDQYKNQVIQQAIKEAKEYERSHGNSGNFFTDFRYGLREGNKFLKQFNKYASPILNKTAVGSMVTGITSNTSGVIDKL
jgi:hypothetical protein